MAKVRRLETQRVNGARRDGIRPLLPLLDVMMKSKLVLSVVALSALMGCGSPNREPSPTGGTTGTGGGSAEPGAAASRARAAQAAKAARVGQRRPRASGARPARQDWAGPRAAAAQPGPVDPRAGWLGWGRRRDRLGRRRGGGRNDGARRGDRLGWRHCDRRDDRLGRCHGGRRNDGARRSDRLGRCKRGQAERPARAEPPARPGQARRDLATSTLPPARPVWRLTARFAALYATYTGSLYQLRKKSDSSTKDVPVGAGGFVDISVHNSFCPSGTACTISIIYDQSPNKNDLKKSETALWLKNGGNEADAAQGQITVSGHVAHGIYVDNDGSTAKDVAYRNNATTGLATGDQPEAIYAVLDGKRYSSICCFDYGNAETTNSDAGSKTMEASTGQLHAVSEGGSRQRPMGRGGSRKRHVRV